jgi:hypothetical protein
MPQPSKRDGGASVSGGRIATVRKEAVSSRDWYHHIGNDGVRSQIRPPQELRVDRNDHCAGGHEDRTNSWGE